MHPLAVLAIRHRHDVHRMPSAFLHSMQNRPPRYVRQFVSAGRSRNKTKAFEWHRHFSGSQIATGVRQEMTYLHVHTQRLGGPLYSTGINFLLSPPRLSVLFRHQLASTFFCSRRPFCLTNQRPGLSLILSIGAPAGWPDLCQLPSQPMQTGPSQRLAARFHTPI